MINRKVAPAIHDAVSFDYNLQPVRHEVCGNNIPLYWLNAGTQEVVQIDWVFDAGLWHEPKTAVAQAAASLLRNGTATQSALAINEAIEYYGAALKVSAGNDYTVVTLHTLTKHLAKLLPVVQEIVTQATFPQTELDTYIRNAQQRLAVNLRKCDFVANRHIDGCLFGKAHPYGRYTEAAHLDALQVADLQTFHRRHYTSRTCRMFMAGNIEAQHVALLQAYFGKEHWGEPLNEVPAFRPEPAAEHSYRISNDANGVQGAVRLARPFPTREHPDFTPMLLLNTVFGGYFGSRLMTNIREEKGFTYGIHSQLYSYKHAGAMLIATEAGKDVCAQTMEEVYKEMALLCREPIGEEELMLVKNYLLGNILGDLDGPFGIMQRWKNVILNQLPADYFDTNIHAFKTLQPEALLELAQRYYKEEDFYELVVV
ncbi:MAG: pitrilysin family protein [Edaphocola sp.]